MNWLTKTRIGILVFCVGCQPAMAAPEKWLATWGCAPQLTERRNMPPEPGLGSNTLRQVVRPCIGGKKLRTRFSNEFGDAPLTILSVHVARSGRNGGIDPETDREMTFGTAPSITIPAGKAVDCDPFDFDTPPRANLAVTIHFGAMGSAITGHPGSRATSYLAKGDVVAAARMSEAVRVEHWYILAGLDVLAADGAGAIAAVGDSITDGRGSTTDGDNRWPDALANRLATNAATANVSVINEGIGGNAVVSGGLGPTALKRFDRDALEQSCARWIILFEGVNDIGNSGTNDVAQRLTEAYKTLIGRAHSRRMFIYGATITPFGGSRYFSGTHEAARQKVNEWIRSSKQFDSVIDFDSVVRDPAAPTRLLPAYDTGDHLHLNPVGYKAMGDSIDLRLFQK